MGNDKTKKVKKRVKIKILPLLMVFIVGALIYLLYLFFVNLPIKNIYVNGNYILNDQQIIENAGISDYPSFFKVSTKKMISELKNNPYILSASIKKRIWNEIHIVVQENTPCFINTNNKLILSDGGETEEMNDVYVPKLINYVPDVKYEELIKKISKVELNVWQQVSEIKYEPTEQDKDRFGLYMNDGNLVYLTLTKFNKLNYYNDIINEFNCQKGILNLDSGNHFEIKKESCE